MNQLRGSLALLCVAVVLLVGVVFVGWSTGEHSGLCSPNAVVGEGPHTDVAIVNGDDQPHRIKIVVETDQGKSRSTHCLDPHQSRTVKLPYADDGATFRIAASLYWNPLQHGMSTSEDNYNSLRIDGGGTIHLSSGTP